MIPHDVGWAVEQLKLRRSVRRNTWTPSTIVLLNPRGDLVMGLADDPAAGVWLWSASTEDLLATDWTSP